MKANTQKMDTKGLTTKIRNLVISSNARIYYWCFGVVVLWRVGLELLNQTIVPLMTPGPGLQGTAIHGSVRSGLLRWVYNWDAGWYAAIVQKGYYIQHHLMGQESIAFFPLFPYLVRILSEATGISYKAMGLLVNLFFTAAILFFVYKLTVLMAVEKSTQLDGSKLGKLAALFVLLGPSSFFFAAYYADALLVLLVTASVYFAYRDKYIVAALFAGLATGTKSIGVVMLPTLLALYITRNGDNPIQTIRNHWRRLVAISLVSVSGILLYMSYLWARFGNPLIFIKIEKYWLRDAPGNFINNIWIIWYQKLFKPHYYGTGANYLYSLFLMLIPPVIILCVIYLLVKHKLQYAWLAIMCLLTLLIPISTGTLESLNRYLLILTPLLSYMFVHIYTKSHAAKKAILAFGCLSSVLMVTLTLLFLSYRFAG